MSLHELLRLLRFAPATDRTPDHRFPSMSRNLSGPPDLCPASTPRLSRRNKKAHPCELSHSGATIAELQLPDTSNSPSLSLNRTRPSVNIQVRLKYQDSLKIRWN